MRKPREVTTMFPDKTFGLMAGAAIIGALALGPTVANAQANCTWYAETALKQQQRNERGNCGLSGTGWSSDLRSHVAWCSSVAPDVWKRAAQQREQELAACSGK